MITAIVTFDVEESKLKIAKAAITAFVHNIQENESGTLRYSSYQDSGNPLHFVHYMEFKDEAAHQAHRSSSYIQNFIDALYPCCIKTPEPFYLELFTEAAKKQAA